MSEQQHSSPIEFPCDFVIKAMGKNNDAFKTCVRNIVKQQFPQVIDIDFSERLSKGDAYLAITANVHAQSQAELDALYQALSDAPEVIMAL